MKKQFIILFMVAIEFLALNGFSQNLKIDSLKIQLQGNNKDTTKLVILKELCRENRKIGEFNTALNYAEKALTVGNTIVNKSSNVNIIMVAKNYVADVYNNMGIIRWNQGSFDKAFEKYYTSIKIRENVISIATKSHKLDLLKSAKIGLAASYNNIGLVFESRNEFDKAIENYTISLKIQDEIMEKVGVANTYNNIGVIYYNQKKYDKALENYKIAKKIYQELGNKQGIGSILSNEGIIYKNLNLFDKALENQLKGLKIREEIQDKIGVANSYSNIGNIYYAQNKIDEAKKYLNKSLQLSIKNGSKNEIMNIYQKLSNCDSITGNWKESLLYYKFYKQYSDSIFNEEGLEKSIEMGTRFETEKKEAQIKLLEKEKEKQSAVTIAEKKQQKAILLFIIVILGLVVVFSIIVYNRYRITQQQNKLIEEQKIVTEHQKQLVEIKNKEITDSINYAKRIQSAILPPTRFFVEHFPESFIIYKPKDIVAGDFYWLEQKDNKLLFAVADCTGHGVPGAMVSVICNNGLNRSVREYGLTDPGEILNKTREIVIQEFEKSEDEVKDGMDIALCSLEKNVLKFAGANNPLWIIRKGTDEIEEIKPDKQPIGKYAEPKPFFTNEIVIQKGDVIYLFSDGFADQFGGEKGKKFKASNFKKLILSIQHYSIIKQQELINGAFENWKGDLEQLDDVCVIGISV